MATPFKTTHAETGHDVPHILLVDDDQDIRTLLGEVLQKAGFAVSAAGDGPEMRRSLGQGDLDLIVLDLNLPREDGLSLCREVRATQTIPIIMLTARADPIDRILGLELGADDYVTKPFEPRELVARIRSVMRRVTEMKQGRATFHPTRAAFDDWVLDFQHRHLIGPDGMLVMLSGAEYGLLRVMVDHPQQVLTREQLVAKGVGGQADPSGRAIDLQISRLRQKLGDDVRSSPIIKTVRNQGYVFAAPVRFR